MSFIIGLVGVLIALIGWFVYESLPALIIGTVFYIIETVIERKKLNAGSKIIDVIIFVIGLVVALFIDEPLYVGGMVALNIYSAIMTAFSIPMFISGIIDLLSRKNQSFAKQPNDKSSYTDEQIQSITSSYNSAFLVIKDYNNGKITPSNLTSNDMLYQYIINSFYICLGWCVFHANTAKKQMVLSEIDRFVDDLEAVAPESSQGMAVSALKTTYRCMSDIMLRYKKDNIDPSYLQDNSKENYNKLITAFVEYVCKISKIEWYDGIVEDFKHCMDE